MNIIESQFANKMSDVTKQISTACEYFHELDLGPVFAMPPEAVVVADRLSLYCRVDRKSGDVFRGIIYRQNSEIIVDYSHISDDQLRLCSNLLRRYRLLPPAESETGREIQFGLVVSEPYNDDEGIKWIVMTKDGDLLVLNARHLDAHEVLQAPSEKEIYDHWEEIDQALKEENLQEPIHLALQTAKYTNWRQILDTVPPRFLSEVENRRATDQSGATI